jgi:hypothetical protein
MKRIVQKRIILAIGILLSFSLIVTGVLAAGDYQIGLWSTDGGGSLSYHGEELMLMGSASRITAREASKGGSYSLAGGYWGAPSTAARDQVIFIPIISLQPANAATN